MDLSAALSFAVKDIPAEHRAPVAGALVAAVQSREAEPVEESIDRNIDGPGGQAFLWEDVLTLSDALDAFGDVPGSISAIDPSQLATVLLKLLGTWKKLRAVRVPLDENQFKVLRAIKRGQSNVDGIASYAGLDKTVVEATVASLKAAKYRDDLTLVEDAGGTLTTRF